MKKKIIGHAVGKLKEKATSTLKDFNESHRPRSDIEKTIRDWVDIIPDGSLASEAVEASVHANHDVYTQQYNKLRAQGCSEEQAHELCMEYFKM